MAGFGFSIGDIIAVGQLAMGVFKSCVKAGPDFQAISQDGRSSDSSLNQINN
jgi:hypothetical protein